MKLQTTVFFVFLSLLLWSFPAKAEVPKKDQDALRKICAESYCRPARTVKLIRKDGSVFETPTEMPLPIVQNGMVTVMPDETLYLEADEDNDVLKNIKAVQNLTKPEKTIVMKFRQDTEGAKPAMMLEVHNPFSKDIKYHIQMMLINNEKLHKTTSCPVGAKLSVYESWPHPIFQLVITDFRLLPPHDRTKQPVCEY